MNDIEKRLEVIEDLLGIKKVTSRGLTKIKAVIKKGSNDFNNNVTANPFPAGSQESEWWIFGFNYAKELDEQ